MENNGTQQLIAFITNEWRLLLILTLIFLLYFHYTKTHDFFKKKNIEYQKPIIFFGNILPRVFAKISFIEQQQKIYKYFKGHRYGGFFEGRRPLLYVFDPDIIKAISIRDADHFIDRLAFNSKQPRYLSRSVLSLKGAEWKAVRSLITPTFSSARLKNMFPLVQECADKLVSFLSQYDKSDIEIKDIIGRLTLEVTGSCAFGINSDVLSEENAEFIKVAEKFNYMPPSKRILLFTLILFMPELLRFLNISFLNAEANKKLVDILKKTKAERTSGAKKRNDFLQLLVDAAAKEQESLADNNEMKMQLDDDTVDAQALIFLIGGYETTSTLLAFTIHMMCVHPDIQDKLRDHIEKVTKGEPLCYEHLSELDYLEGILYETLRIYPPVARVERSCTKPYVIPDSNVKIDVGDVVAIPVYGIHMDPDIYPEPEKFIPERFMKDERSKRPSHLFLAFGAGPRGCIGLRFSMIVAKVTMVTLLRSFKFSACSKTEIPIKLHRSSLLLKAQNGVHVHIEKII